MDGWIPGLEGRIETLLVESEVLRGNPLNDPNERPVMVYLPPEFETEPERRFPVVLCLTGFTGTGRQLLHDTPWRPALPRRLEDLVRRGAAGPMILVFPDAFTRLGGSQYLNSPAVGRYEDHILQEVIPRIAERYRTLEPPRHWGVMGKSSGGYGALRLAMKHPEAFAALACHSGDMYFPYCYLPDFPKALRMLRRHQGLEGFLKAFQDLPRKTSEYVTALNIVAMAACYSPRDDGGIELPFDLETGEIRQNVWERWLEQDPVRMIDDASCQEALKGMRLVYLDCGTRDEFNLEFGARIFTRRLKELGISHVYEEFDDGHFDVTYRYERSLSLLWKALREA
jgi:enterochelin esterase family protein